MILSYCLVAWLLPLLGQGLVLYQRVIEGSMTLHNYARYCQNDGSSCLYTFGIEEDPDICQFSPCVFTVNSRDGKPANQTDFQSAECKNMKFAYRVNGGWDSSGYMTIVITNANLHTSTYVSYRDDEARNGDMVSSRTQPSYQLDTFPEGSSGIARREPEDDNDDGEWWQIQDMFRSKSGAPTTFSVTEN